MFCPACGSEADETAEFCAKCGATLKPAASAPLAPSDSGAAAATGGDVSAPPPSYNYPPPVAGGSAAGTFVDARSGLVLPDGSNWQAPVGASARSFWRSRCRSSRLGSATSSGVWSSGVVARLRPFKCSACDAGDQRRAASLDGGGWPCERSSGELPKASSALSPC